MEEIAIIIMEDNNSRKEAVMAHLLSRPELADKIIIIDSLDKAKEYFKNDSQADKILANMAGASIVMAGCLNNPIALGAIEVDVMKLMASLNMTPPPKDMIIPIISYRLKDIELKSIVEKHQQPWMQRKNFNKHAIPNKQLRLNKNTYRRKH